MKNEIRALFSVSLENGITITGKDPYFVVDFLTSLETYLYWAADHFAEYDNYKMYDEISAMMEQISNGALFVCEHLNKEEDEQ